MRPPDEERTAEISESLRALEKTEHRWTRLVGKFYTRPTVLAAIVRLSGEDIALKPVAPTAAGPAN